MPIFTSTRSIPKRFVLRLLLMHLECAMHKASGGEDSTALQLIATTALTVMDQEESSFFAIQQIPQ